MDTLNNILYIIGLGFVLFGSIFLFLGALGIYRMPDLYNRLQAGTKASTLGAMSVIFGVSLMQPDWLLKLLVIIIFIGISNPLSSHILARASYQRGIRPFFKKDKMDDYEAVARHQSELNENEVKS
jgi:multicomponent Na+:H+ antiporter subunit G